MTKTQGEMTFVSLAPRSHGKITLGGTPTWRAVVMGILFILIEAFFFALSFTLLLVSIKSI